MFSKITNSKLVCSMQVKMWFVEDKIKNKVKDEWDYAKNNPGKTAAKVATNMVCNTVMPGGTIAKEVAKKTTKTVIKKAIIDKDRVKSLY